MEVEVLVGVVLDELLDEVDVVECVVVVNVDGRLDSSVGDSVGIGSPGSKYMVSVTGIVITSSTVCVIQTRSLVVA